MALTRQHWEKAYQILNEVTPLPIDCGQLCNKSCCSEWEDGVGMYLFPGEEVMFTMHEDWLVWEIHHARDWHICPAWEKAYFVQCTKPCPRERRPFACRTFPLLPRIDDKGKLMLDWDDEGLFTCPLVQAADLSLLHSRFLSAVLDAWTLLAQDHRIVEYLKWRQKRALKAEQEPWMKLFK